MRTRRFASFAVCAASVLVAASPTAGDPAAAAGPRALMELSDPARTTVRGDGSSLALVGDHALVAQRAGTTVLRLSRVALGGAPAFTRVLDVALPDDTGDVRTDLTASAAATGMLVDDESSLRLIGGPAIGPLAELGRYGSDDDPPFFPVGLQAAGTHLFATEFGSKPFSIRTVVHEPGAAPVVLPYLAGALAVFAGDLAVYAKAFFSPTAPSRPSSSRAVLADWRTGTQRAILDLPRPILSLGLADDGRVAVGLDAGGIVEVRPGGQTRQVSPYGYEPRFAGDRIVFLRDSEDVRNPLQQLVVAEPDGRLRDAGVPTTTIAEFEADARRILWSANGCLLVTDIAAPPARAPGAGPCRRTELHIQRPRRRPKVLADRRVPVTVTCVAAAVEGCRGTLTLATAGYPKGASGPLRFRIVAGTSARLRPRLTRAAYVALRKRQGIQGLQARARATDPAGRRSSATAGLQFSLG